MALANENVKDLIEMYKRLIAEQDAKNEALQASFEKEKATNDRKKRKNAEIELKIKENEKKVKEGERKIIKKMVSINSRCNIAASFKNAEKMETVLGVESEFIKELKALGTNFEVARDNVKAAEDNFEKLQIITDREMNAIRETENRIAVAHACNTRFEDKVREIDDASGANFKRLDILIAKEQERKLRNSQLLAEKGIVVPENSLIHRSDESK